jgi:hypothetical protein
MALVLIENNQFEMEQDSKVRLILWPCTARTFVCRGVVLLCARVERLYVEWFASVHDLDVCMLRCGLLLNTV